MAPLASIRLMSGQVSRGSAGGYQADERAGVARLSWRVSGRTIILIGKYIQSEGLKKILQIAAAVILIVTVVGRLISGVHWFSDIMGGIFISLTLVSIFAGIVKSFEE